MNNMSSNFYYTIRIVARKSRDSFFPRLPKGQRELYPDIYADYQGPIKPLDFDSKMQEVHELSSEDEQ